MALSNTAYQTNPLLVTPTTPAWNTPVQPVVSGSTPGAMQMTTGAQASMVPPVVPTVAPTPVVPGTAPEPTVGQTLGTINSTAISNANPTIADQVKAYQPVTLGTNNIQNPYDKPINEKQIQQNQLKMFQSEIDATNKVYDQLYNQKVLEGTGRLGTQRAQAARGGLLGSDFGTAQQEKVQTYNTAEQQAVQAERQAKIGSIMGKVRTAVADEIAAKRLARTQDADAYLKYLTSKKETRQTNLNTIAESFIQQGLDPATMTPDEIKAVTEGTDISAADLINSYQTAKASQADAVLKGNKTQAEIDKLNADTKNAGYFNLSEGQSRYDANGKVIASKGKTYAPGTDGSGTGLTPEDKRGLLGGGWSSGDISLIESDVKAHGLTAAIENAKANGADSAQIEAMKKAYGAGKETQQFLTPDYFSKLFTTDQLAKAATDAGFTTSTWGGLSSEPDTTAYLTHIQSTIDAYRQAGYSDQEILKMMQ